MCALAYLFPGQGSQRVGMGRALYESSPAARSLFHRAEALLDFPLVTLCFEGPEAVLTETRYAQPALLVTSLALWEWARSLGAPAPAYFAGHSLGHFSALTAAGAVDFEDALQLVRARAEAMQRAAQHHAGGMAAVIRLARPELEQVCRQASAETGAYVGIANDNSPDQLVISGEREALERAMQLAKEAGARRVVPLAVSGAFHSPLVRSAAEEFRAAAGAVPIRPPAVPVISNVAARPLLDPEEIRADMIQQLTNPVRWTESVRFMMEAGVRRFIEIGPGTVLSGLVGHIAPEAETWSLESEDGPARLQALSSADISV